MYVVNLTKISKISVKINSLEIIKSFIFLDIKICKILDLSHNMVWTVLCAKIKFFNDGEHEGGGFKVKSELQRWVIKKGC